jgi:hypothetical protein
MPAVRATQGGAQVALAELFVAIFHLALLFSSF